MRLVVRQLSGLGNQMFQYAAGRYFEQRYGAPVEMRIDPPEKALSYGYARPFLLSKFATTMPFRPYGTYDRLILNERAQLQSIFVPLRRLAGVQLLSETPESQYHFHPDLALNPDTRTAYLSGYWQAKGYVDAVETKLREEFRLKDPAQGRTLEVLQEIEISAIPISVHVRRGDYTRAEEGNRALTLGFYKRAMQMMVDRFEDVHFFVFSDDIAFAKENLPRTQPITFVDHNDSFTAHEDLRLMSACHHHIIANSSFSWWGAWMNPRPDKVVIAPREWLTGRASYFPDLLPREWILLDW